MAKAKKITKKFLKDLAQRNPHEIEFQQAVTEVVESVMPWYLDHDKFVQAQVLERVTEPDRILSFRVSWTTDAGEIRVNRAWRVQFCNALGPYKGGLRFHPSVNQSVLKFLGFEQTFKNSLTGLPMGGAKGGSNFDPKGKSDAEVMRFCQSMMLELARHIGEDNDVPAGDIGVGAREIGYLFGQYMRMENRWSGALTGKAAAYGGSALRTEATGYGCIYFLKNMLEQHDKELSGKRLAISGSGNVALYAAEQALAQGAKVLTLSDSGGFIHCKKGFNPEQLAAIKKHKEEQRGRLEAFADGEKNLEFAADRNPWSVECDIALPCATQNELDEDCAKTLINNGVFAICEGANMPVTADAAILFKSKQVLHAPGKASNAGGVAVSGFEQSQNAMRLSWSRAEVEDRLQKIMADIHQRCVDYGSDSNHVDYIDGANIAGFKRVCKALAAYGVM